MPTTPLLLDPRVAVVRAREATYPVEPPFHPAERYPEYADGAPTSAGPNHAYESVREVFRLLRMDAARFGTPDWNPLGEIVAPGAKVVVKPNYVLHTHYSDLDFDSVITHSSVVRAVTDYALKAAGPAGTVTIADSPLRDADFGELVRRSRMDEVMRFYESRGCPVRLVDMRWLSVVQQDGVIVERTYNRDPLAQSRVVDVGSASAFREIEPWMHRVGGADYDRRPTREHHSGGRHEYRVSQLVLDADVVLSVGKLKTHKKAGVTLSLKNLVGINVDKNFLPHYRIGMPCQGGDEFPDRPGAWQLARQRLIRAGIDVGLARAERIAVPLMRGVLRRLPAAHSDGNYASVYTSTSHPGHNQKMIERFYSFALGSNIRDGNWSGNDTAWRMVVDLNTVLLYCDAAGRLHDEPVRGYFSVIDGIVGGAGEGPMNPTPVASGVVVGGFSPLTVDWCATQAMGFEPERLRVLAGARGRPRPLGADAPPVLVTNVESWAEGITPENSLGFEPHRSWSDIRA